MDSEGKGEEDPKPSVAPSWSDQSDPSSEGMVFIQGGLWKNRYHVLQVPFAKISGKDHTDLLDKMSESSVQDVRNSITVQFFRSSMISMISMSYS